MVKIFKIIFLSGLLILYIYAPPFQILPFGPDKLVTFLAIWYLFTFCNFDKGLLLTRDLALVLRSPIIKRVLVIYVVVVFYSLVLYFVTHESLRFLYLNILLLVQVVSTTVAFAIYSYRNFGNNLRYFFIIIILAGTLQSIFSFILILNPELNYVVNNNILKNTTTAGIGLFYGRGFGFTAGRFFSYAFVQGLILSLMLFFILRGKKIYLTIFIPFFLLAIIYNARVGLVPVFISLIVLIIPLFLKLKKACGIAILLFIILPILIFMFRERIFIIGEHFGLSRQFEWAYSGYEQIIYPEKYKEKKLTLDILLESVSFPEGVGIIFGTGADIYRNPSKNIKHSDIGYIIQLHYGGFIYLSLILGGFLYIFYRSAFKIKIYRSYALIILVSMLIANIKGNAFFSQVLNKTNFLFLLGYPLWMGLANMGERYSLIQGTASKLRKKGRRTSESVC